MGYLNLALAVGGLVSSILRMWPLATAFWAASSMLQTTRIIKHDRACMGITNPFRK